MPTFFDSPDMLAVTIPAPHIVVPAAAFVSVTLLVWLFFEVIFGTTTTPVEERLEELRDAGRRIDRGRGGLAPDRSRRSHEAVAVALERATRPLTATVSGTAEEMNRLRERLLHAGFRREQAPVVFKSLQLILGALALLLTGAAAAVHQGVTSQVAMKAVLVGGLAFYLPILILAWLGSKRKEAIFLGLPDALDLMVVCVEAGLGLDQAMRRVGEEMTKAHRVIADEFRIANQHLQFGRPRQEVLHALGQRNGVEDLQQLASILIQADKFGSSVGQALRVQSDVMRVHRRQLAEEKAAKTAVTMIFPLVLFIFPGIFVVLVGPAAISMYRNLLQM